jgi:hypothetical protein
MSGPANPRSMHWRRHGLHPSAVSYPDQRITYVASACGRLVDYRQAVGDAGEADCEECEQVRTLLARFVDMHVGRPDEVDPEARCAVMFPTGERCHGRIDEAHEHWLPNTARGNPEEP